MYDSVEVFATEGKQYPERELYGSWGPWALSWHLFCVGILVNLIQARIIWEVEP